MAWWQLVLGPKEVGIAGGVTRLSLTATPGKPYSFSAKTGITVTTGDIYILDRHLVLPENA